MPVFHFVKGVHVTEVTPAEAAELRLGDDMASNEIVRLSIDEFLSITDGDQKPIDHGFDRKSIAQYFRGTRIERTTTPMDCELALKAYEWMEKIHVPHAEVLRLEKLIVDFVKGELQAPISAQADGAWKSATNRETVKKAAQKVIDALVSKLLPPWIYQGKKGEETACQVKVQEAAGVSVNEEVLPSFLTLLQMFLVQTKRFEKGVAGFMDEEPVVGNHHCRNIKAHF